MRGCAARSALARTARQSGGKADACRLRTGLAGVSIETGGSALAVLAEHQRQARELLNGRATDSLQAVENALNQLLTQVDGEFAQKLDPARVTTLNKKSRQLADAVGQTRTFYRLLRRHIEASGDQELTAMELQLKSTEQGIDSLLGSLRTQAQEGETGPVDLASAAYADFKLSMASILKLSREDSNNRSIALSMGPMRKLSVEASQSLNRLKSSLDQRLEQDKGASQSTYVWSIWVTAATTLVGVTLSLVMSLLVTRSITRPLAETVRLLQGHRQRRPEPADEPAGPPG